LISKIENYVYIILYPRNSKIVALKNKLIMHKETEMGEII